MNGEQILYTDISDIEIPFGDSGLALNGALFIYGSFTAIVQITCHDGSAHNIAMNGKSALGFGSRWSVKKNFIKMLAELRKYVAPIIAQELIANVQAGNIVEIGYVKINSNGVTIKRGTLQKDLYISNADFGNCEYVSHTLMEDDCFIFRNKAGKNLYKVFVYKDFIYHYSAKEALLLPALLNAVYRR
ncbi:MAG: hypothetical protein LBT21_02495 [Oscillospiraceae bacterium]|nr:hypothetical protein [Oscillospiraceae bacterium]